MPARALPGPSPAATESGQGGRSLLPNSSGRAAAIAPAPRMRGGIGQGLAQAGPARLPSAALAVVAISGEKLGSK